jgi:hypothetical protein
MNASTVLSINFVNTLLLNYKDGLYREQTENGRSHRAQKLKIKQEKYCSLFFVSREPNKKGHIGEERQTGRIHEQRRVCRLFDLSY